MLQWLNSYLIEKSVWEKWNLEEKLFWAHKAACVWIKHQVNNIQTRENLRESVIQGVSQQGKFIATPNVPHGFQTEMQVKIMRCKTARSNYLSPLLSKANYSTCGTDLILRYLLWSLSPFSSCSVCSWVFLSFCEHSQVYPICQPTKARYSFFSPCIRFLSLSR